MTDYIAVTAPDELVRSLDAFLHAVDNNETTAADRHIELVDHMSERVLNLFLAEPRDFLDISNTQARIFDFAIATAENASHLLMRQIYKKKTPVELKPIAANMREMYWPADHEPDGAARLGFPVAAEFAAEFREAAAGCAANRGTDHLDQVERVMNGLTDALIEHFFLRNVREVEIGYVARKSLDMSVNGTKKAVYAVNHRVLRNLDNEHLKLFMAHHERVLQQR